MFLLLMIVLQKEEMQPVAKGANYIPKKRAYSPESDISGSPKTGHL